MMKQTSLAISQADAILFVVDARDGVTPYDKLYSRSIPSLLSISEIQKKKCSSLRLRSKCHNSLMNWYLIFVCLMFLRFFSFKDN